MIIRPGLIGFRQFTPLEMSMYENWEVACFETLTPMKMEITSGFKHGTEAFGNRSANINNNTTRILFAEVLNSDVYFAVCT